MKEDRILVDTTVWIKFLRGLDPSLKDRLGLLIREERACTTEVIILEILNGARSDNEYNLLEEDFSALPLLSVDQAVWQSAGRTAYRLRKLGINVPLTDVLIATVAIRHQCRLMNADKHFKLISKHTDLKVLDA